jgi:hypothetical protein
MAAIADSSSKTCLSETDPKDAVSDVEKKRLSSDYCEVRWAVLAGRLRKMIFNRAFVSAVDG